MNSQVKITDSAHAMVLATYLLTAVSGALFQSGVASASVLEEVWPHGIYVIWASTMLLAGLGCFIASIIIPRMADPRVPLRIELIGCLSLVATLSAYEWSLLQRGLGFAVTTQVLVLAIGLGALCRAIQIVFDLVRVGRAFKIAEA